MKPLYVVWLDACSGGDEWLDSTHPELCELAPIYSCGFLLKETDSSVTLVLSKSEDGLIRGFITIPKSNIIQLKEIEC